MANQQLAKPRQNSGEQRNLSPAQQAVVGVYNATRSAKFRSQVLQALPPRMKGEKAVDYFCSGIYSAVRRNPDLVVKCRPDTLYKAAIEAAERGVRVDNGEAWLVPYKGKVEMQIGYKGAIKLAKQAGILMIDAQPVYANDKCRISLGTMPEIEHTPAMSGDRGELLGVYAWVRMSDGEPPLIEWMPKQEIDKIRNSGPSANSPAWKNWYEEMARVKALKRISKRVPAKDELDLAQELRDMDDMTIEGEAEEFQPIIDEGVDETQVNVDPDTGPRQIEQSADPVIEDEKTTQKASEKAAPADNREYSEMDFD